MRELCSNVRCAFGYFADDFMKCYYFLIKFFNSRYRVWHNIEVVCYSNTYDYICHVYFLFHSSWACYKGLTLFDYFSCGGVDLCFPFE